MIPEVTQIHRLQAWRDVNSSASMPMAGSMDYSWIIEGDERDAPTVESRVAEQYAHWEAIGYALGYGDAVDENDMIDHDGDD